MFHYVLPGGRPITSNRQQGNSILHTLSFSINSSYIFFSPFPIDMEVLAYCYLTMAFAITSSRHLKIMAYSHILNLEF